MRSYGRVPTSIWLEEYPSEDVRTLVLYVACGPHSNGVGCYRLPVAYIAEDLKWTIERAQAALDLSTGKGLPSPSEALAKGLAETETSPSQALLCYDSKALWIAWPRAFDASPIESPNGAKSLIPFLEAIPKESIVFQVVISAIAPFSDKFPKGFLEGLGKPFRSPTLSPTEAEQAASSSSISKNILPSETVTARATVDNFQTELDLSDSNVASVVIAKMLGRKRLTAEDQSVLLGWCKSFDIEHVVLPWLEKRITNYKNLHNLAHPLKYFHSGLNEHVEKSRIKK